MTTGSTPLMITGTLVWVVPDLANSWSRSEGARSIRLLVVGFVNFRVFRDTSAQVLAEF